MEGRDGWRGSGIEGSEGEEEGKEIRREIRMDGMEEGRERERGSEGRRDKIDIGLEKGVWERKREGRQG